MWFNNTRDKEIKRQGDKEEIKLKLFKYTMVIDRHILSHLRNIVELEDTKER